LGGNVKQRQPAVQDILGADADCPGDAPGPCRYILWGISTALERPVVPEVKMIVEVSVGGSASGARGGPSSAAANGVIPETSSSPTMRRRGQPVTPSFSKIARPSPSVIISTGCIRATMSRSTMPRWLRFSVTATAPTACAASQAQMYSGRLPRKIAMRLPASSSSCSWNQPATLQTIPAASP
jgi:hypothetical protein